MSLGVAPRIARHPTNELRKFTHNRQQPPADHLCETRRVHQILNLAKFLAHQRKKVTTTNKVVKVAEFNNTPLQCVCQASTNPPPCARFHNRWRVCDKPLVSNPQRITRWAVKDI
ncbi:hypothetical protein [Kibdelosporangium philippinense]|uniref:hypothetical protein n=1 Tax=Kibdelosporangium philippinense TaxID=211113 RepID=UPI00360B8CE5